MFMRTKHHYLSTFDSRLSTLICLVLFIAIPASADWHSVGSMTPSEPQGNQVTFRNPQATAIVTVLAPDLVRVRMIPGATPGPDHSWAVAKTDWPHVAVQFTGSNESRIIRTSEIEVRVQLSPFRVAFYDLSGRLIAKDADDRGMSWEGERVRCWKWMPPDEQYFGLGEKSTPLDKRGRSYVMWNTDPAGFDASTDPLYQSVPFLLALREGRAYGLFFDNTYRSSFDLGVESPDLYSFGAEGGEINYYFFSAPDPKTVIGRFTDLVGRSPLPPRWALGYIQSRYSYYPERKVRFIAENFRERRIPCDGLFLDIDYMDGFRIFTWDKSRFPDPHGMLSDLRREGFHIIAIVDPYVKVDPQYWVYQQGMAGGYFLKKPDGTLYAGKGWPGESVFPDFASAKARAWWGSLFQGQLQDGVDGFLTDMNEPTIFKDGHPATFDLDLMHETGQGPRPHAQIHNVYGMLESSATRDGMLRFHPNERPLIITRATFAGGQRYAAQWSGDNWGTWDHLRLSMPMLMTMGLSGLQFSGADIGGIFPVPSPELYTRWLEAGVFTPFCWTHSGGPGNLEPWAFGNRLEEINRHSIELRYKLLPYLYNAFWQAAETGMPIMRPLLLDYPDDSAAIQQNDEFLLGGDLLIAPVTKDDDTEREVYLPRGVWYDFWTDRRSTGPERLTVDAPLERIPVFVRGGAIVPSQQLVQYTGQASIDPLIFDIYPSGTSTSTYYEDDGISFDYQHGVSLQQRVAVAQQADALSIELSARQGLYTPPARALLMKVHGQRTRPRQLTVGGKELSARSAVQELENAAEGWAYDDARNIVWLKVSDRGVAAKVEIR
jgi:alpha-glucosidase